MSDVAVIPKMMTPASHAGLLEFGMVEANVILLLQYFYQPDIEHFQ